MSTIHQNKMTSGTHDLTGEQAAKLASILRDNDCPYLIFSDGGPEAAPTTIVVMRIWAPLLGQALGKVLDPDKPVPPSTPAALFPALADNGEIVPEVPVTIPEPVANVAQAA